MKLSKKISKWTAKQTNETLHQIRMLAGEFARDNNTDLPEEIKALPRAGREYYLGEYTNILWDLHW